MLLTLTTTLAPATDLGFLLHKNPFRAQSFALSFGSALVFYPEVSATRCTAALAVDVDPVALVRGHGGPREARTLDQYVNDRPYAASSFLSVAIAEVFGAALAGRSKERPDLAARALPLEARLVVVPCRGGEELLRRLFEPLGYTVEAAPHALDEANPAWGTSRFFTVTLRAEKRLAELLAHLTVLVPVLDDDKHYWVGDDEVAKLVRRGEGWLATHPERETIARRYLAHQRSLARRALEQLVAAGDELLPAAPEEHGPVAAERLTLNEQRIGTVLALLKQRGAQRVLDLGCGEGQLLRALMKDRTFTEILGVDASHRALEVAADRLRLAERPDAQRARVKLLQGALTYRDARLAGWDAAAVVEVIEHLDPPRLGAFARALFEFARPATVVLTTPNAEYNVKFERLPAGQLRHRDHRFEWSRAEFTAWAEPVAARFGYAVRFLPVGPDDPEVGAPTQLALFTRAGAGTVAT